ncbi:retrovirus-related pol polyprotein from transposon TNT 1-94 [Tanacetum coccineum]
MCHIIGIEPQFENIIKNGPFIPMVAGQRKPEGQWTVDQRLKSLFMFVLPDDQINSVINFLTAKSTWDDLILYHEGPSDVKESRVMDLKLCYNTFKFKEGESLTQTFTRYKALMNETFKIVLMMKRIQEAVMSTSNDLEEEYQARALLAKSKRFFKKGTQRFSSAKATDQTECHKCGKKGHFARDCWSNTSVPSYQSPFQSKSLSSSQHKPELRPTKDFEAKYNKVKAKLALLSSSASASKASTVKNKGLIAEAYEWDEEEVSSDDNEMVEVKVLMALAEDNDAVSKEGARNGEWVKISMRKVHTLLEMEDNDDRKTYLDYLCIDLNYVEEQRNNLLSKHRDLVHELNACKEQLLVLKQAKLDFLTMQHINTEILKENKNLRTELKELIASKTWLNSSNKVNQCISKQIRSQKKRVMGVDQLTEDPSSSGQKDLVFVKSSTDDTKVSIPDVERPWLSKAGGFILPNHDTGRLLPAKSQRNTTDLSVAVTDSSATEYDSTDESSVCSTPFPLLKKLNGVEPTSGPKTIKSILRSKSIFKAETLKGAIINKPSSAPDKGNKNSSASVVNSAPAGKLKSVKIEDDPPLAIVMKFDEKRGTIFNSNKEVVMIAPRVRDVYVLDMTSCAQESCFFAKAFKNLNWLWHKRLAHLNFKTINKLAKQKLVIGLPSLVYSKNKPCSSCEKVKHHKANFKTKQTSSIKKCLHLLHIDLFGPVTPRSINHEKYPLVIVDDYSRNNILVNFCDEKGISQNFSSPYTPEQNGVAERKNRTLIEAARTMLSGSVFLNNTGLKLYLPDEYLLPYEPSQRYQTNNNDVSFIEPYESPEPVVLKIEVSSDQKGQTDQNDQTAQIDEIFNDKLSEHSNHNNDEPIIDNLPNTKDIQISKHLFSPNVEDTSVQDTILIPNPPLPIPSVVTPAPQDRWSQDKHIELVNIIGNPSCFESNEFPNHVWKLDKALYGLKQASRSWYETLSTFLSEHKFVRGKIDNTLFVYKTQTDVTLVQIYVDDIIFRLKKFEEGISINQEKYVKDLLKKYDINGSSVKTPMVPPNNLRPDLSGKAVNETQYLKGTPSLGLWYPKCSGFDLKGYSDSDYAGYNMDKKSTSGAYQLLGGKLVCWSAKKQHLLLCHQLKLNM